MRFLAAPIIFTLLVSPTPEPLTHPSALGGREVRSSAAPESVSTRLVRAIPGDYVVAVSADGRLVAGFNHSHLLLHDLATGTDRQLPVPSNSGVTAATFSRDGRLLAYHVMRNGTLPRDTAVNELRVIGVDGMGDRLLYSQKGRPTRIVPESWSPDGKWMLATVRAQDWSNRLTVISLVDGSVRTLKSLGWRFSGHASVSPDGRFVAYDFPLDEGSARRGIFVLAVDGSRESRVTRVGGSSETLVGWAADGRSLYFVRDDSLAPGARSVWQVAVVDGKRSGDEHLLRGDVWGMRPIGMAGDRLVYSVETSTTELRSATLSAGVLTPTVPTAVFRANIMWYAISPDGAHAAYFPAPEAYYEGGSPVSIFVRSLATGTERELEVPLDFIWGLSWEPDGRSILARAQRRGQVDVYRIDLQSGKTTLAPQAAPGLPMRTPDGRTLIFGRQTTDEVFEIIARDLATGREHVIYPGAGARLSPDGRWLALVDALRDTSVVVLAPVAGGEPRFVARAPLALRFHEVAGWLPDGSGVLVSKSTGGPQAGEVVRVPVQSAHVTTIALRDTAGIFKPTLGPDGTRLFYSTFLNQPPELWVMEHLPASPTPRR